MSLNASLAAALSGLSAASRAAQVVSSNVSNAMTDGYGPRELALSSSANGAAGGVVVDTVRRNVDLPLLGDSRIADAGLGRDEALAESLERIEAALGLPGEGHALATRITELDTALTEAVSRPDSAIRLDSVLRAADGLAAGIVGVAREIQDIRSEADAAIASGVDRLNDSLAQVASLNDQIKRQVARGDQPNGLFDQRQRIIDGIAELVPLKTMTRPHGAVALFTEGGAVLLDGRRAEIGFSPTHSIGVDTTLENGALSGLTIDHYQVSVAPGGRMGGGSLAARFAIRDEIGPEAQAGLDALARDLVTRFEAANHDAGAPAGAGLFTDRGAPLDPAREPGLSLRLAVNAAADPDAGGSLWRLRDGLGAVLPGEPGETEGLSRMVDALAERRMPDSGGIALVPRSFSGLASDFLTDIGTRHQTAQQHAGHAAARSDSLHENLMSGGVDTDAELQKLLLIESSYAANARVLRAADEMLQTLLGI